MNSYPNDNIDSRLAKIYFPHAKYNKVRMGHLKEDQQCYRVLKISPKTKLKPCSDLENSNTLYRLYARNMHLLGERPMLEFCLEIRDGAPFESTLKRYSELAKYAEFIQVNGGKDLPPNARLIISNT